MANSTIPCPEFTFTSHPSVSSFAVPFQTYIADQATISGSLDYQYVAVGAHVFSRRPTATDTAGPAHTDDNNDNGSNDLRVLLIQRAAHDSAPLRWEVPGGASDLEDASILHSVARELWEEAGLVATAIGPLVGQGHVFLTRSGKRVCKFEFLVEVEGGDAFPAGPAQVRLDPNEHVDYVWATEQECRDGRTNVENVELSFTTWQQKATLLEAFKVRKELHGSTIQS
ncbi:uncharacterized protein PV07_02694 [Cladophialophora immunda]|uniref:Nudix hydrolase domain-containing protein n=1 Tax=Cladophialophora immunda TaxID=569365 RepID=A0A0D2D5T1_9EURO|nr:uncharacterized protein PV07_02694 [Cladophialophora immunda]KIW31009.1 hypothetical protein PV07_02694 [Cladophialophora immunda]